MPDLTEYLTPLRRAFAGRRHIVVAHPDGAVIAVCRELADAGGAPPLAVGSGGCPDWLRQTVGDWIDLGLPGDPTLTGARAYQEALTQHLPELVEAVNRYDPEGEAVALGSPFYPLPEFAGRRFLAPARPELSLLDSDVTSPAFLAECGLPTIEGEVVPVDGPEPGLAAHRRWAANGVTRWTSHPRETFTFDGELVREVGSTAEALAALESYRERCDHAFVSRPLRGFRLAVDCLRAGTDVQIVEFSHKHTIVHRDTRAQTVFAAGTLVAPDPSLVRAANTAAQAVGRRLGQAFGFSGAFTLEAVVPHGDAQHAADPPVPVRWLGLATRLGGTLIRLGAELGLPFHLLIPALVDGRLEPAELAGLGQVCRSHRMQRPRLSAWLATGTLHPEATGTWWVTEDGSEWRLAMPGERPSAVVEVSAPKAGPAGDHPPLGLPGRVRLEISPTVVVAPQKARGYVIGCLAFLDDLLALGLADQYLLTG